MQRIRLLWAALAALVIASGCTTDSGGSMIILRNQVPGEGCEISANESDAFYSSGIIDTNASRGYVFTPLVQSLVSLSSDESNPRLIAMRGADVEISFPSGFLSEGEEATLRDDRLTRFSQAFSGSVRPGDFSSFSFVVVPTGLLTRLGLAAGDSVQLTVKVSVFGDLDGSDVESDPFVYPIEVCNGCMTIDNGDCAALGEGFEGSEGGECNVLQDVPVDCCTMGGDLVCPVPG
jgi:hypothetical protein